MAHFVPIHAKLAVVHNAPGKACALDSNASSMSNRDAGGYGKVRYKSLANAYGLYPVLGIV